MRRRRSVILASIATATLVVGTGFATSSPAETRPAVRHMQPLATRTFHGSQGDLTGIGQAMAARWYYAAGIHRLEAVQAAQAAQEAAARARAQQTTVHHSSTSSASSGASSGSCQAMKPAGFPDYIIQRESGGQTNPTESPASAAAGAEGCVQILSSHFSRDCAGMSYGQCWGYLYRTQGLQPWSTG